MQKIKIFFFTLLLLVPSSVSAREQDIGLSGNEQPGGVRLIKNMGPGELLGTVLKNTIGILFAVGTIGFTIMIVWGAVDWILSGGDKEKVAGARKRILTAITGLVLLSLSFVIMVVLGQILNIEFLQNGKFILPRLNTK